MRVRKKKPLKITRIGRPRTAALKADDGIISTSSLMSGIGAASSHADNIVCAGVGAMFVGAMSMAAGEYVSVSSQAAGSTALSSTAGAIAPLPAAIAISQQHRVRGICGGIAPVPLRAGLAHGSSGKFGRVALRDSQRGLEQSCDGNHGNGWSSVRSLAGRCGSGSRVHRWRLRSLVR